MSQQCISINIEGEFVDSFIYSGTLFLVHASSIVSTYNWETLLGSVLHNEQNNWATSTYEFLKDCRQSNQLTDRSPRSINIDKQKLEEAHVSALRLPGWPTDINIYANHFYIASENGVEELPFDWRLKRLDPSKRFYVWRKYAYKISANDAHRLAIAAGSNGVITATPRNGSIEEEDIVTLLEIDSHDCEWVGRNLVANSLNGAFVSTFSALPEKPRDEGSLPSYWKNFNALKKRPPETREITHDGKSSVVYAWVAGSKLFSLLSNGELLVERANINADSKEAVDVINDIEIDVENRFIDTTEVFAARSGLFGAVIELENELRVLTEEEIETVSIRPVNWRVFPRAKSYLNHLHVIEKDKLSIRAYFLPEMPNRSDWFGINIEDVIGEI